MPAGTWKRIVRFASFSSEFAWETSDTTYTMGPTEGRGAHKDFRAGGRFGIDLPAEPNHSSGTIFLTSLPLADPPVSGRPVSDWE